ncbi:MAG: DUF1684 domain-containing protein [Rhodocyclaceae bacterium]|nr:DUF1684 domain-containing protein [Rhodocyclaceae bacterium]
MEDSYKAPNAALQAHEDWRRQRLAELTAEDGWLTLVGLEWLDDGVHRLGADPACALRVPGGPASWGELTISGGQARWTPAGSSPRILDDDRAGAPTVVAAGRISFFLIARDGRLGLRIRDAEAAARRGFRGIPAFPFDPAWCLDARWDGNRAGFRGPAGEGTLVPQNPGAGRLHFVIADATSGRETYGGGRFLFAPAPVAGEALRLDFNRAINPPCAFTPFAVCPLPPPGNRLPFPVAAGEKTYRA